MDSRKIFEAAREADVQATRACIEAGIDPAAVNECGVTALQCAAMGSNQAEVASNIAVLRLLLEAGSPLEYVGADGRTALYVTAEFAPTTDAVQLIQIPLIARGGAGAFPRRRDGSISALMGI